MNSHTAEVDYIIVGQGIAGTLLSYFLREAGFQVLVIDVPCKAASSMKAAGIINPVTGRRFAKSWMIEELLPFAKFTYKKLEDYLGIEIWHDRNLLRALTTVQDENEWWRRSSFDDFKPWFVSQPELEEYLNYLKPVRAWGETKGSAQVNFPDLLNAFRQKLLQSEELIESQFDALDLMIEEDRVSYSGISASGIIFCEGAKAVENPYFKYLPFVPTKGEYLIVKIPGVMFGKMIKHGITLVRLKEDLYWAGASSRFEHENELPTHEQKEWLHSKLSKLLAVPFQIIEHEAAIRPTVFDIRPFLGHHPVYSNLMIFNGLGTKGASLGPYFANHLVNHLSTGNSLIPEVDISRFAYKE